MQRSAQALRRHINVSFNPESCPVTWTHTHLGRGADSVSSPRTSEASRQAAANQGRRHVSLHSGGVANAHAWGGCSSVPVERS